MRTYVLLSGIMVGLSATMSISGPKEEVGPASITVSASSGFSWTGAYAGVSVALGRNSLSLGESFRGTDSLGLHLGYLHDLGDWVVGAELSASRGDIDGIDATSIRSTRVKAIAGRDLGRFLPYAFVGATRFAYTDWLPIEFDSINFGLGLRHAIGQDNGIVIGLEYLTERKDNVFGLSDFRNHDVTLRLDYRF